MWFYDLPESVRKGREFDRSSSLGNILSQRDLHIPCFANSAGDGVIYPTLKVRNLASLTYVVRDLFADVFPHAKTTDLARFYRAILDLLDGSFEMDSEPHRINLIGLRDRSEENMSIPSPDVDRFEEEDIKKAFPAASSGDGGGICTHEKEEPVDELSPNPALVSPSEFFNRLAPSFSVVFGDPSIGRFSFESLLAAHRIVVSVVDELLNENRHFFLSLYSWYLEAVDDIFSHFLSGVAVKTDHFPQVGKRYCWTHPDDTVHAGHCDIPADLIIWSPSEIADLFRLKTDDEVLEFVAPVMDPDVQGGKESAVENRATRFAFISAPRSIEVFVFKWNGDTHGTTRVYPHFLSLKEEEGIESLVVEHLRTAVAFCHDLAFFSTIKLFPSTDINGEDRDRFVAGVELLDAQRLISCSPTMSFFVHVERPWDQKSAPVIESGSTLSSATAELERLVVQNLRGLPGRKMYCVSQRQLDGGGYRPCDEEYLREKLAVRNRRQIADCAHHPHDDNFREGALNSPSPKLCGWGFTTFGQDSVGFSWMFADPAADTEDGRRSRKNLNNLVTDYATKLRWDEMESRPAHVN